MTLQEALRDAIAHHRAGRLREAEQLYRTILSTLPEQFDALHLLARIAAQQGHPQGAEELLQRAVGVNPASTEALLMLASVHNTLQRHDLALAGADHVLTLQPQSVEAWAVRGMALHAVGRVEDALASYDRALALQPDHPGLLCNRGAALKDLQQHDEAVRSYDRVLALQPAMAEAWSNRGGALSELARHAEALGSCDQALALLPAFPEALHNRGAALSALGRHAEAIDSYSRAIELAPRFAQAHYNRGSALGYFKEHAKACVDFERALELDPGIAFAAGALLHSRMHCCDWRDWEPAVTQLLTDAQAGKRVAEPMTIAAVARSPADVLACTTTWVATRAGRPRPPLWQGEHYGHERIRVAYLSADFHEHATAQLMVELFERHDRNRFEVTAVSFGPPTEDAMRARLRQAFEHFIEVRDLDDLAVAQWLRDHEIDIAIDLKGYTYDARSGIFAHRAVPVQVNYLGYPGTLGARYIDYIVADATVVPAGDELFYAEQVVRLPWSYQVNDSRRAIDPATPSRAAVGLPETGFVFCCFNSNYKITPDVFATWMQILRDVEGSVLWLFEGHPDAVANLRREALAHQVDPLRLIFAPRMPLPQHLARHRLADLFLDTGPYNAHTTASDALWAGLPVVTCPGTTFASRVAASLLRAMDLPDLVTASLPDYASLAVRLARSPEKLAEVRARLAARRTDGPLFDGARFARNLEAAFATMMVRSGQGLPPLGFDVPDAIPLGPSEQRDVL